MMPSGFTGMIKRMKLGRRAVIAFPLAWLTLFFLLPFALVLKISLSEGAIAIPPYGPLVEYADQTLSIFLNVGNYLFLLTDSLYVAAYWGSIKTAFTATVVCLLLGYPMAYAMARAPGRWQLILLLLVMLPSWTSFLIRVYAWMPQRGFLRELDRLDEVPQVWMMQWKIESCQSILAVGPEQSIGVLSRLRVTTGDSWVGPVKILSTKGALQECRDEALLRSLSGGESRRVVELPVQRGTSLFGLPGSINWQGDGLLVLVPLMQMFVVMLVLRFVCRLLRSVAAVVRASTLSAGYSTASLISETIRLVVLIALFHQFGTTVTRILTIRNGIE